jgi:hypothetical protein
MTTIDKKAAVAAYKERKTPFGIYTVRCSATGQAWVGRSQHLDTQQNGLWFALRHRSGRNRDLQAAWDAHGEATFTFAEVERLADETLPYLRQAMLKERLAYWRAELGAALL